MLAFSSRPRMTRKNGKTSRNQPYSVRSKSEFSRVPSRTASSQQVKATPIEPEPESAYVAIHVSHGGQIVFVDDLPGEELPRPRRESQASPAMPEAAIEKVASETEGSAHPFAWPEPHHAAPMLTDLFEGLH